ncbi:hypothetical protein ACFYYD_25490 [Streptomyces bluensis]|uniref:hypothetical protein n=1 Tax=Streptomyces bluensis TaxID=33897 RepID=UPI0036B73A5F
MYLVQLSVNPPPHGGELPGGIREVIAACASEADALEHVSVLPFARPRPVIGLFLRAASPALAEESARCLWYKAASSHPPLVGWELSLAEVPLLLP